ncbi:TetR/AcrR family transcriptional regulator [Duganella aceris]|uniref:TetR family transcriptional regulator n=1 Tax=Duganella aceris TaxID=2703883 RepID=A0ABX0FKG0_9BURK|nr:TetR/AcrR family transcriptional regulator [Duganella aceris]NGZ85062.1 TetR family transcriptional regulator [Duganella aceris]
MKNLPTRDRLLTEGLRLIHEQGFGNTTIFHIVKAAGVSADAFDEHFACKEDFALQVLDVYFANGRATVDATLRNDDLPPLDRLRQYLALNLAHLDRDGMRNGCLYGNFAAEGSDYSDLIRHRITEIFEYVAQSISYCLRAAAQTGKLRPRLEYDEVANFAVASLQGAILLAKAQRSPVPVLQFERSLFSLILA